VDTKRLPRESVDNQELTNDIASLNNLVWDI